MRPIPGPIPSPATSLCPDRSTPRFRAGWTGATALADLCLVDRRRALRRGASLAVLLAAVLAAAAAGAAARADGCPRDVGAAVVGATSPEAAVGALDRLLASCPLLASSLLASPAIEPLRERADFHALVRRAAPQTGPLAMTPPGEPGRALAIDGEVRDRAGRPIADALVYLFQTDASGVYTRAGAAVGLGEDTPRLFAWLRTGADGKFAVTTIRPGRYPNSRILEHVHAHVEVPGRPTLRSELVFADDPELDAAERAAVERRGWVVCESGSPAGEGTAQRCRLPLVLGD